MQSGPATHPVPGLPSPTQAPPLQWLPCAHAAFDEHVVAQPAPLQRNAPQDTVVAPTQWPPPSQWPAVVPVPFRHDGPEHTAVAPHFSQAPPWHRPSVPQLASEVAAHLPRGSSIPSTALLHVPSAPPVRAAEQAWQAPAHAWSQQTPSTQKPLLQSAPIVHAAPWAAPPAPPEPEVAAPPPELEDDMLVVVAAPPPLLEVVLVAPPVPSSE